MLKFYIIIKSYNDDLAKRQPWYSIKKLISDLESMGNTVEVVNCFSAIPSDFCGKIIKVFSLSDLWKIKKSNFEFTWFVTFPIYRLRDILKLNLDTFKSNWKSIDRIVFMALLPRFLIKRSLSCAEKVIVTSDRLEKEISGLVCTKKYIPYIYGNWGNSASPCRDVFKKKTIGYLGPPYKTRYIDGVIDFFNWITAQSEGEQYNKKMIIRIEREELKEVEEKILSKLVSVENLEVLSGFLNREELLKNLLDIDVLILPFRIIMSELPIVVLEALELGIGVITTVDCGIADIASLQNNILVLDRFNEKEYQRSLDFINTVGTGDFQNLLQKINDINTSTLEEICQR